MPRSIAAITKELKLKEDTAAKTETAVEKRVEIKKTQAGIISDLRPKISKLEMLIGTIDRSLKDSKTKKANLKGLETQKKGAEAELKPLETKMEAALKEYDVCEKLIETLSKSDQPIQESIKKLRKELEDAQDGQVEYGKARTVFKLWYTGEITKMEAVADAIHKGAAEVAKLLTSTEAAADRNDLDAAQKLAKQAQDLSAKVQDELKKLDGMQSAIAGKKGAGRNLSLTEYNVVAADVQVHATLNKSILALFAEEDMLAEKAADAAKECKEDAADAATRAVEGAKTAHTLGVSLGKSLAALQVIDSEITAQTTRTWGKIITDEGISYVRAVTNLKANPTTMVAPSLKNYEQSSIYVPEAFVRIQRLDARIQAGAKKALATVPTGLGAELAEPIGKIEKLAADSAKFLTEYTTKKTKTLAELEKLNAAIEALG